MAKRGRARFREAVISALLTAPTIDEAAAQSGVSRRTIQRWLDDPEFAQEYRKAKAELVKFATGRLKGAMAQAVETLEDVSKAKDCPPAARVSASRAIIELGLYSHEADEVVSRLEDLERRAQESEGEQ